MLFVNENRSNRLLLDKNTNIPRIRIKKTEIRRIRGRSRIRKELRSEQRGGKEEKKEIESELAKGNLFHALLEHTRSIYPKSLQRSLQLPSELPCCNHVAPRLLGTLIKERIGLLPQLRCVRKEGDEIVRVPRVRTGSPFTQQVYTTVIGTVWTVAKTTALPNENCEKLRRECNLAPSVIQSDGERVDSYGEGKVKGSRREEGFGREGEENNRFCPHQPRVCRPNWIRCFVPPRVAG